VGPLLSPALRVENLAKRYGRGGEAVQALVDVSFEVGEGEAFALLGENGAGKSTIINTIATLIRPDAGRVLVRGHDVAREPDAVRRLIGVALQDTGVPRRQTARRLLRTHARLHGCSPRAARARTAELVESFGLAEIADREIARYSGGQRRRLDLAIAFVHHPKVVLLDEPTGGLDIALRRAVWEQLEAQLRAGTTLLFSTHDLQEADQRAHKIAIVDRGRILASSTPRELRERFSTQTLSLSFRHSEEATRALAVLGQGMRGLNRVTIPLSERGDAFAVLQQLGAAQLPPEDFTLSETSLAAVFDSIADARDRGEAPAARWP
jgi:ABC-type multidrug transport system ATPase subunit